MYKDTLNSRSAWEREAIRNALTTHVTRLGLDTTTNALSVDGVLQIIDEIDHKNQRRYPRALYELGAGPNARKPKPDPNARKREYEARKKSILKTSSVFNLAVPLKCLRSRSTPGTKTANSASNAST